MGGAHAIAALALGAGQIKKVDKIFGPVGPGRARPRFTRRAGDFAASIPWPARAKCLILADGSAPAKFAAADLSAQLEHGADSWAFLVSDTAKYIEKVLAEKIFPGKNLISIVAKNRKEMIALANRVAPEHLEVQLKNAEAALKDLTAAPAVFVGPWSPVASGDYIAGPNHSLPTARAAFNSPLGVWDFMKRQSIINLDSKGIKRLAGPGAVFAELEGLKEHSRSLKIRLEGWALNPRKNPN